MWCSAPIYLYFDNEFGIVFSSPQGPNFIDGNANVLVQNSSKYVLNLLTQMELNYGRRVFTAILN